MPSAKTRVVITGGSSGIGAASAIAFAEQGAHIVLGARDRAGLDDIAGRCRDAGGTADVEVVDVTDAVAVAAFAARRVRRWERSTCGSATPASARSADLSTCRSPITPA